MFFLQIFLFKLALDTLPVCVNTQENNTAVQDVPKKLNSVFFVTSSPNGFSRFFHCWTWQTICKKYLRRSSPLYYKFPQNVPVKKFENRSIFGKDMDKNL